MKAQLLRNQVIRSIRQFFVASGILEVCTSKAVFSPALEPYIDALEVKGSHAENGIYLATSPEFALKKIFAAEMAASPAAQGIYEIAPVFRDDRPGKHHALEFTMVEWYMKDCSLQKILASAAEMITSLGKNLNIHMPEEGFEILNLSELFKEAGCAFDFADPHSVISKYESLHHTLPRHLNTMDSAIGCFNLLFDEYVLPGLKKRTGLVAVSSYPGYLAALAFSANGIAERAEIFYRGIELANGYCEEYRPEIARGRWSDYNTIRALRDIPAHSMDEDLLLNLKQMQGVSGIAVGLERLLTALFPDLNLRNFR